jgi:hypothetical protein
VRPRRQVSARRANGVVGGTREDQGSLIEPQTRDQPAVGQSDRSVTIYQNYFDVSQIELLDPAFIAHDGTDNPRSELKEIALFRKLYRSGVYKSARYTGIVSQKFRRKSGIAGRTFIEFIEGNTGFDVYFINPFPQNAYFSFNVWEHGNECHKGLADLAQRLFDAAGLGWKVADLPRNGPDSLLYCNYWAGNEKFWHAYMALIERLLAALDSMPQIERNRFFEDAYYLAPAPMLNFILERVFSSFLMVTPGLKGLGYRYTPEQIKEQCLYPVEVEAYEKLHSVIDAWDREGSYSEERRNIFQFLLAAVGHYCDLQISISGHPERLL